MGHLWTRLFRHRDVRILLLGLDSAGKTTLLYRLKLDEVVTTVPTIGFNVESIQYRDLHFTAWDIGSRDKIRPLFRHYYKGADAVVFVIDSHDPERLDELNYDVIKPAMNAEELKDAVFLFLANKVDLSHTVSVEEIVERLGLQFLKHIWNILPVSAVTGEGLYPALDWLCMKMGSIQARRALEETANPNPNQDREMDSEEPVTCNFLTAGHGSYNVTASEKSGGGGKSGNNASEKSGKSGNSNVSDKSGKSGSNVNVSDKSSGGKSGNNLSASKSGNSICGASSSNSSEKSTGGKSGNNTAVTASVEKSTGKLRGNNSSASMKSATSEKIGKSGNSNVEACSGKSGNISVSAASGEKSSGKSAGNNSGNTIWGATSDKCGNSRGKSGSTSSYSSENSVGKSAGKTAAAATDVSCSNNTSATSPENVELVVPVSRGEFCARAYSAIKCFFFRSNRQGRQASPDTISTSSQE